jgi:hypothetical protein
VSGRTATRLACASWALAVALLPAGPLWLMVDDTGAGAIPFAIGLVSVQLAAASAGAVIASRMPRNAVGWIFLALGLGLGLALACGLWAAYGIDTSHGPVPGDEAAAWVVSWLFLPVVFGLPVFLLMLFPDGRFLSRRWRRLGWTFCGFIVVACVITSLVPGRIDPGIQNPVAPGGAVGDAIEILDVVSSVLSLPVVALAIASLVVRFRRSRGVERQQLKWFTYAAALAGLGLFASTFVPAPASDFVFLAGLLALAGMPVAAVIAILRYRLYDIDLVINRTLVYGALTATLAGTYVGLVLLLQLLLSPGSDLAIAGSTLAVAALFRPARARIQAQVDRRFYRQRYDAGRTLQAFAGRLRDEIELDSLSSELRAVVMETMQPAHVSLWLREAPR